MGPLSMNLAAASLAMAAAAEDAAAFEQFAKMRISSIREESADRSTPERAIQSFFRFFNNKEEISCLSWELRRLHEPTPNPVDQVEAASDKIRDGMFSGLPLEHFHQFDYLDSRSFKQCMEARQTFSYVITGVEPTGTTLSQITLRARNTTPLTAQMKPDDFDLERRAKGSQFRFSLERSNNEWKITQIEEKSDYSDDWDQQFSRDGLGPLVPSLVMFGAL